jgi:TRAP-type C4-dicarboxylate transport system permease small subunit
LTTPKKRSKLEFAFLVVPQWIMGAIMLAGIGINFANVVSRYLFGRPFFWTEEVLVFMVIWGVFLAMGTLAYQGEHLNMDLVSSRFRGRPRLANNALMTLSLLACCAIVAYESFELVTTFARSGEVSVASGVPMAVPHAAVLAGFLLMALGVLARFRAYLKGEF